MAQTHMPLNPRLLFATLLMIAVWAAMAGWFRPSSTPTVEQLLPAQIVADAKQLRDSLQNTSHFVLLYFSDSLPMERRQTLLQQLEALPESIKMLCLSASGNSSTSAQAQLRLSECNNAEHSDFGSALFWHQSNRSSRHTQRSLHQTLEAELEQRLEPSELKQIALYSPESIRSQSWQAANDDLPRIAPLLGLIILTIPLLAFRSLPAPAFIFLTASSTTTLTLLIFNFSLDGGFNALLLAVIPLIWAVSSMDAAHLVDRLESHHRRGTPQPFRHAFQELIGPCSVTTATTFIGFGALALQDSSPLLRSFGLTAAAGTGLALVITFLLGWLLLEPNHRKPRRPSRVNRFAALSHSLVRTTGRYPLPVLIAWLVITLSMAPFATRVTSEIPFPNIFASDHPMSHQTEILQQRFSSDLRPLTLYLTPTKKIGSERDTLLHAVSATSDYLSKLPEVRLVLPTAIIPTLCDAECRSKGSTTSHLKGYLDDSGVVRLDVLLSPTERVRQQQIIDWLRHFDQTMLSYHRIVFDGPGYLYPKVESLGLTGALNGLLISLSGIILLLFAVFRQLRLVMAALLVTLLPLWFVVGIMGTTGINWSLALLGVPAMLFGLAVDDTIHLLWHRKRPTSFRRLLRYNAIKSGTALTSTTLMLCLCVATLGLSSLQANQHIAILLSFGMALALLLDLTLLPALLSLMRRKSPRQQR
ncbi:MAG: MMPL family transporter [Candidatus Thiodiazotropha taylori]